MFLAASRFNCFVACSGAPSHCLALGSGHGIVSAETGALEGVSATLGGAVAWPLAARAQQGERIRRIGVLFGAAAGDPVTQLFYSALLQGLQQLGWTDGRNIHVDPCYAAGNAADLRKYASELVALAPDVFVALGPTVGPLLQATRTVPIGTIISYLWAKA